MEEEVRVAFELGGTSPAFRSLIGTNNGIGSWGLIMDGTIAQQNNYRAELGATTQTLYRFVGPKGELRADGEKLLASHERGT